MKITCSERISGCGLGELPVILHAFNVGLSNSTGLPTPMLPFLLTHFLDPVSLFPAHPPFCHQAELPQALFPGLGGHSPFPVAPLLFIPSDAPSQALSALPTSAIPHTVPATWSDISRLTSLSSFPDSPGRDDVLSSDTPKPAEAAGWVCTCS